MQKIIIRKIEKKLYLSSMTSQTLFLVFLHICFLFRFKEIIEICTAAETSFSIRFCINHYTLTHGNVLKTVVLSAI